MSVSVLMDDPPACSPDETQLTKESTFPLLSLSHSPLTSILSISPSFLRSLLISFIPSFILYLFHLSRFLTIPFCHSIILTLLSVSLAFTLSPLSISHSPPSFVCSFSNSFLSHVLPLLTFSRSPTLILSLSPRFLVLSLSPFSQAVPLPPLSFTHFPPYFVSHFPLLSFSRFF